MKCTLTIAKAVAEKHAGSIDISCYMCEKVIHLQLYKQIL